MANDIQKQLARAKRIRAKAEKQASKIEMQALSSKRKSLLNEIAEIDHELERMMGKKQVAIATKGKTTANRVDAQVRKVIHGAETGIIEDDIIKSLEGKFDADKIKKTLKARLGKWFTKKGDKYLPRK